MKGKHSKPIVVFPLKYEYQEFNGRLGYVVSDAGNDELFVLYDKSQEEVEAFIARFTKSWHEEENNRGPLVPDLWPLSEQIPK